jgi:5-methylcytosine-specific restriction endonuclease McrA
MATPLDLTGVYVLDAAAWSPRTAVYRVAVQWAQDTGRPVPTNQEVFTALCKRGFRESKRRGTLGFNGIAVPADVAAAPRLSRVAGTVTAYKQGDRSPESRAAASTDAAMRALARRDDAARRTGLWDPFTESGPVPELSTLLDGASVHTRVSRVLVSRAETRWGSATNWHCVYCGNPARTVDHWAPWTRTRNSRPANLVPCCGRCQNLKGSREPDEFMRSRGISETRIAELRDIAANPDWHA